MKKIAVEVHRTSGNTAQIIVPEHLDHLEVRGIVESVMEQLLLESLKTKHENDCRCESCRVNG